MAPVEVAPLTILQFRVACGDWIIESSRIDRLGTPALWTFETPYIRSGVDPEGRILFSISSDISPFFFKLVLSACAEVTSQSWQLSHGWCMAPA